MWNKEKNKEEKIDRALMNLAENYKKQGKINLYRACKRKALRK